MLTDLAEFVPDRCLQSLYTSQELLVCDDQLLDALILLGAILLCLLNELLEISLEFLKVLVGFI